MNKVRIIRVARGSNSTLSHLYLENCFLSYLLEDRISEKKEAGLTCIPEGHYELVVNTTAPMNERYVQRFAQTHKGMLEIAGIPDFKGVFLHIGNTHSDTRGCPLTGFYWMKVGADYQVCQSAFSYLQLYPTLLSLLQQQGRCALEVLNRLDERRLLWTSV